MQLSARALAPFACLAASTLAVLPARAATVTTLYKFHGGADGDGPVGPLIADPQGSLYGSTRAGGANHAGVIFRLTPPTVTGGPWTETVLYDFADPNQGFAVAPPMILGKDGSLFGTTYDGGVCEYSCGVAFRLSPGRTPQARWRYTVLFEFPGPNAGGGGEPAGSLISDGADGYLGTTYLGGAAACTNLGYDCGTVFHLTPPDSRHAGWTETVLHSFRGMPDGAYPAGAVVADGNGNFFGATEEGGTGRCNDGEGTIIGCGTIYQLSQTGSSWSEKPILQIKPGPLIDPIGPLVVGVKGALYGASGYSIFRLTPHGDGAKPWTRQILYQFKPGINGTIPYSSPVLDSAGRLYGATASSGLSGFSTLFRLSPPRTDAGPWHLSTLARFGHGLPTEQPSSAILLGRDGTLYGTLASRDGSPGHGHGSIFAVAP